MQRDSKALTPKVGTHVRNHPQAHRRNFGRLSDAAVTRIPTLLDLRGIVVDASLKWKATGLTTATLTATSRAEETVVAGWSGALRRDVGVQVDHALRRWLIWTVRAGYGLDEYVGVRATASERKDKRMSLGTALTYKFNREFSLKGEYRYDQMHSNAPARATTPTSSWSG